MWVRKPLSAKSQGYRKDKKDKSRKMKVLRDLFLFTGQNVYFCHRVNVDKKLRSIGRASSGVKLFPVSLFQWSRNFRLVSSISSIVTSRVKAPF